MSTKVVVLYEIHWVKFGSAEKEKEWATDHFRVSVMTKNSLSRPKFSDVGRDRACAELVSRHEYLCHDKALRPDAHKTRPGHVHDTSHVQ